MMNDVCGKCGSYLDRKIDLEYYKDSYVNIYGTFCPNCGAFISSDKKYKITEENKKKKENIKQKVLDRLKMKWRNK